MKRLDHDIFRVSCSQRVMSDADACQFLGQTIEKMHAKISRGQEAGLKVQNWQIFKADKATLSSRRSQARRGELVTLPNSNQETKFAI